ncbi:MAG: matrix metalloproteinase like mmp-like protein [Cotesia congregata filamentous virus 2]
MIIEILLMIVLCMIIFVIFVSKSWQFLLLIRKKNKFVYDEYLYKIEDFPLLIDFPKTEEQLPPQQSITTSEMKSTILSAINTINSQTGFIFFNILNNNTSTNNILKIRFNSKKHDNHLDFDGDMTAIGKPDILAHSLLPPNKAICLDIENQWNCKILESVLLHELGHALGLLDNTIPQSIMSSNALLYDEYQYFDLQNLKILYPWIKKSCSK